MNITESLLHALKAHGATRIFGIPGDFALPFFRIIEESEILPLHTLSHEPGVGFAADAAARINCALGVAAVTYGAGALKNEQTGNTVPLKVDIEVGPNWEEMAELAAGA